MVDSHLPETEYKEEQEEKEDSEEAEEEAELSSTEVAQLKNDLEAKTNLADDYLSRLKYLQADFENYKKMVAREREMYEMCATEEQIKNLLPIIDNLKAAIASSKQNEDDPSFVKGIELIYANLVEVLGKEGLKPIKAVGMKFDPYTHEVLLTVLDDELPEDTIVEELEKGYVLGSKVIRTSKVTVSKVKSSPQTEEEEDE
jgi:molecular chaperone GrpE